MVVVVVVDEAGIGRLRVFDMLFLLDLGIGCECLVKGELEGMMVARMMYSSIQGFEEIEVDRVRWWCCCR